MKVKIFIVCHDQFETIKSDVLTPILVGGNKTSSDYFISDYTSDEISSKNNKYCELTAIYWAWKNCDADYIGFMHYRRHFNFNETVQFNEDIHGSVIYETVDKKYIDDLQLHDETILKVIDGYDILVPTTNNLAIKQITNTFVQYGSADHHDIDDYIKSQRVLIKKYPEFSDSLKKYNNSKDALFCNMFIMRREVFKKYCEWLFDILSNTESLIDYTYYNKQEYRALSYIGERLLGIYITKAKENGFKVKHLQRSFVHNVYTIPPQPNVEAINIAISIDNKYAPIGSVLLRSILTNSDDKKHYNFIILYKQLSEKNIALIKTDLEKFTNKTLIFRDIHYIVKDYNFATHTHFTQETYFRFVLPEIFYDLDKIIYLDCDLICLGDISKLHETNLQDNLVAAVRDIQVIGEFKCGFKNTYDYLKQIGMKDPYNYFQAGVIILNLKALRKCKFSETALRMSANNYQYVDQDIFNILCENRVTYINPSWNVFFDHDDTRISKYLQYAPLNMFKEYMQSRNNPSIIHYAGHIKPWNAFHTDLGHYFWGYAKESLWYQQIFTTLLFNNKK